MTEKRLKMKYTILKIMNKSFKNILHSATSNNSDKNMIDNNYNNMNRVLYRNRKYHLNNAWKMTLWNAIDAYTILSTRLTL